MTVRITQVDEPGKRVLKIDGWLQAADLPELDRVRGNLTGGLTLDLSGLRLADRDAMLVLRNLLASGASFIGVSAYLTLELAAHPKLGNLQFPSETRSTGPPTSEHTPPNQED